MPMLPSRGYESEHTRFIRKLLETKPQVELEQKKSRAYWWDKRWSEIEERKRMDKSRLSQPSYVYGSDQGG
jgi:uncharacterized protein DUF3460